MRITIKTTIVFNVPNEYEQAMKFKEEHPDWTEVSDTNMRRYTNMQTYYAVNMEVENFSEIGGDDE